MDLATILMRLWRLRLWVAAAAVLAVVIAIGSLYRVSVSPPAFEKKTISYGSATSQILVDSPRSSLTDLSKDLTPLVSRAAIYADFLKSEPVKEAIARRAGVDPDSLVVRGQIELQAPSTQTGATDTRSDAILGDTSLSTVTFRQNEESPILQIFASAGDGDKAIRLANAAAQGVASYFERVQIEDSVSAPYRVQIRQLGSAVGGAVESSAANKSRLILAAVLFPLLVVLVLVVDNIAAGLRLARRLRDANGEPYAQS